MSAPKIKHYENLEEVGRGGMATVYKALQPSLNRHVAIKVLPPYFQHDQEFVDRFKQEALAIAKLRHPNIVQVLTFLQEGDLSCLVMEYVEGGSLSQLLQREQTLAPLTAVRIAHEVASALDHAHSRGFVHRDIKPGNILLTSELTAIVADFGVTKAMKGTRFTQTSTLGVGTTQYMSPEQIKNSEVSAASDFYSLGILLYQMLTGRVPFDGDALSVAYSQINEEPEPPSSLEPAITPALETLIMSLLEKEADKRLFGDKAIKALAKAERSLARLERKREKEAHASGGETPEPEKQARAPHSEPETDVPLVESTPVPEPPTVVGGHAVPVEESGILAGESLDDKPEPANRPPRTNEPPTIVAKTKTSQPDHKETAVFVEPPTRLGHSSEEAPDKPSIQEGSKAKAPAEPETRVRAPKEKQTEAAEPAKTPKLETTDEPKTRVRKKSGTAKTVSKPPKKPDGKKPAAKKTDQPVKKVAPKPARKVPQRQKAPDKEASQRAVPQGGIKKRKSKVRALAAGILVAAVVLLVAGMGSARVLAERTQDIAEMHLGRSFLDVREEIAVDRKLVLQRISGQYMYSVKILVKNTGDVSRDISWREVIPEVLAKTEEDIDFNVDGEIYDSGELLSIGFTLSLSPNQQKEITGKHNISALPTQEELVEVADAYSAEVLTIKSITLGFSKNPLYEGDTANIVSVAIFSDGTTRLAEGLLYTPQNEELAKVTEPGVIQALRYGEVQVLSSAGAYEAQAKLTIKAGPKSLSVEPATISLQKGKQLQFEAFVVRTDGAKEKVTPVWQVAGDVGSIDATGKFVAAQSGTVEVIATRDSLTGKATVQVTDPPSAPTRTIIKQPTATDDTPPPEPPWPGLPPKDPDPDPDPWGVD